MAKLNKERSSCVTANQRGNNNMGDEYLRSFMVLELLGVKLRRDYGER